MSTERISRARAGFVAGNRMPCRWCGKMPEPPRRTFCSDDCVHEHKLRTDPNYQKDWVEVRDRGVCCQCGLDCAALMVRLRCLRDIVLLRYRGDYICCQRHPYLRGRCGHVACIEQHLSYRRSDNTVANAAVVRELRRLGFPESFYGLRRNLWEMDHIVPVVEGGGDCSIDNLRTLCWTCHRRETSALARRRAQQRKRQRKLF
jgi:5-methylcytosine-specific restriction enzyme A